VSGPVIRTYLELDDPRAVRPAPAPRLDEVGIARVEPPDGAVNRLLYTEVGRAYGWSDRLAADDAAWQGWAQEVETWVAEVGGERAGYYELAPGRGSVEIAHFGLLAPFHGRGLGGWLLTHALRRALELAPRVWLHTCTLDGPAALPNYRARGLTPFRVETPHRR
jgi:GNAT superfamily N-acetyltransferase